MSFLPQQIFLQNHLLRQSLATLQHSYDRLQLTALDLSNQNKALLSQLQQVVNENANLKAQQNTQEEEFSSGDSKGLQRKYKMALQEIEGLQAELQQTKRYYKEMIQARMEANR